jgi:hypothetical protein
LRAERSNLEPAGDTDGIAASRFALLAMTSRY